MVTKRKWYHLDNDGSGARTEVIALARRLSNIEHRLSDLERAVRLLQAQPLADRAHYSWGNQQGEPYYRRQGDVMGSLERLAPWVSTTARIAGDLTSSDTVRRTFGEAMLLGVSFTVLGGGVALFGHLPWYASPVIGVSGFAFSAAILVLLNRTELHRLVSAQQSKGKQRRELRVQIDQPGDHGIDFLYLNSNISQEQLCEFAAAALSGASLAINKWTGTGALFTRTQYEDLVTELERMGYVNAARGPSARTLNAKGRALMRALVEKSAK